MAYPDIILIRHGQTKWNREGRIQGQGDSSLTSLGQEQARAYGRLLADRFATVSERILYRSPAGRCARTTALVCEAAGLDPETFRVDDRLQEKAYGAWEGMTRPEIAKAGGAKDLAAMDADPWHHRTPESPAALNETLAEVGERVSAWLNEMDAADPILVICHGGTGRCLIRTCLDLTIEETMSLQMRQDVIFHVKSGHLDILETDINLNSV